MLARKKTQSHNTVLQGMAEHPLCGLVTQGREARQSVLGGFQLSPGCGSKPVFPTFERWSSDV